MLEAIVRYIYKKYIITDPIKDVRLIRKIIRGERLSWHERIGMKSIIDYIKTTKGNDVE